MSARRRETRAKRQRGKDGLHALYTRELAQAGLAREAALEEADAQLDRIAELLAGAIAAGISLSEVARLTGVSRPTLYELRRKSGGARDLDLDVLVSIVAGGPQSVDELSDSLDQPSARIRQVTERLRHKGWLERLEGPRGSRLAATKAGEAAVEHWDFGDRFEERTTSTLRVALDVLRFSPEERADVERKLARAEAAGTERLGLLEAMRMGVESELTRLRSRGETA